MRDLVKKKVLLIKFFAGVFLFGFGVVSPTWAGFSVDFEVKCLVSGFCATRWLSWGICYKLYFERLLKATGSKKFYGFGFE